MMYCASAAPWPYFKWNKKYILLVLHNEMGLLQAKISKHLWNPVRTQDVIFGTIAAFAINIKLCRREVAALLEKMYCKSHLTWQKYIEKNLREEQLKEPFLPTPVLASVAAIPWAVPLEPPRMFHRLLGKHVIQPRLQVLTHQASSWGARVGKYLRTRQTLTQMTLSSASLAEP